MGIGAKIITRNFARVNRDKPYVVFSHTTKINKIIVFFAEIGV